MGNAERWERPWIKIVAAALLAISTVLGGSGLYQSMEAVQRPDDLRRDMESEIAHITAFQMQNWKTISDRIDVQFKTVENLRSAVESMLARCAEMQARDSSLQDQIIELRQDHRETKRTLLICLGNRHLSENHQ